MVFVYFFFFKFISLKPGMAIHICDSATWKTKAGGWI